MNAGVSAALPGRVFLALAGAFGLFFALATPAHDPPDESRHHGRAWLVSGGWLRVVGEAPGHAASVPWDIAHLHPRGHHYTDDAYHVRRVFGAARRAPAHAPAEMWSRLGGRLDRTQLQPVRILTPWRLAGFHEPHMHPWDCLAGLLLIREAGGRTAPFGSPDDPERGSLVLATAPGAWDDLAWMAAGGTTPGCR
jgi:hypothetical protein